MKVFVICSAVFSLTFSMAQNVPSKTAPPEVMPSPSAGVSPAAKASPTASAPASASPVPAPKATPTARAIIDALSPAEMQEALTLLKSNYLNSGALAEPELNRALLQGLVDRLSPGVAFVTADVPKSEEASPFRAEILDDRIGYLRLGALSKNNLGEMDAALQNVVHKSLKAVILDLRATPMSSDFDLAAEVIKRFTPKGKMLFTIKKPSAKQERMVTSNQEPQFHGVIVAVVDHDTAGAAEVIAAVLRIHANALIVGAKTKGAAVEFADLPLRTGKIVRLAVAEITLPGNVTIFPDGVKPDLAVEISAAQKREIMQLSLEKGISQFVFENERPRMNEAALVAGTNPEIDAMQAAQKNRAERGRPALHDSVLQRAVDLITSIGVFEAKPSPEQK